MKFGADYARRLKRKSPTRHDVWHLDEVVISINGEKRYLWRAVDQVGYVLDEIVQIHRNTKAATFERGTSQPSIRILLAIQSALEAAGVEFLNHGQPGVRLKSKKE